MKNIIYNFFAILFFMFAGSATVFAQANTTASGQFSLQGLLTTTTGVPIADGQHSLTVNVYANGSSSASFTQTVNVMTSSGLFTTMIGANGSSNLMVMPGVSYQLGVSVDGGVELSPKLQLGSSINSLTANLAANADSVGGFAVSVNGNANARANTLFTLNSLGKIDSTLLQGSLVTSIN